jgi:probable rRNA maturation factor
MIQVEFYSQIRSRLPFSSLELEEIINLAHLLEPKIKGVVELSLVGTKKIRMLNRTFRQKDNVTDVLSFSLSAAGFFPVPSEERVLGELFLCPTHIYKQAQRHKVTFKNELTRMMIHGLLHLVGYDHQEKKQAQKMFSLQEKILAKVYKNIFKEKTDGPSFHLTQGSEGVYLE